MTNCSAIKSALVDFFDSELGVSAADGDCVLRLPMWTLDGRMLSVYVEEKLGGFLFVHDGGKTTSELYSQGVHVKDTKRATLFKKLAEMHGATFDGGVFSIHCLRGDLQRSVFAIAQCATAAMFDLLRNHPILEDEPMATSVTDIPTRRQK